MIRRRHRWNFQNLARTGDVRPVRERIPFPFVTLRRGAVQIRRLTADAIEPVTTFGVNGQIAVQTGQRQYNFTLGNR